MGFEIGGEEKDFDEIDWKSVSQEDYARVRPQLNAFQQRKADSQRGVAGARVNMGPVTAAVKGKATSDPYDALFVATRPLFPEPTRKFSFEWWANHFFCECPAADKKEFFKEVWTPDNKLRERFIPGNIKADPVIWRDLLERMLTKGFTAYPDNFKGVDHLLFPPIRDDQQLCLGYRGELRQPQQVKAHHGCKPKAQLLGLRKDMNMAQNWHPFSSSEFRDKVYYRRGNGDNCLYTAVSVAYDFDTASKFPLLSDLNEANDVGTATVEVRGIASKVAATRAMLADQLTRQHFDPNWRATDAKPGYNPGPMPSPTKAIVASRKPPEYQLRLLKSVRMNVYLFRVRSNVWNTEAFQVAQHNASFPERATDRIPWGDFLARIRIDRIHYGDDSNDGHLSIVRGFDLLHTAAEIRQLLGGGVAGDMALTRLYLYMREISARGQLDGDGSGGIDFKTASSNRDVHIRKVIRIEPRTDWGGVRL